MRKSMSRQSELLALSPKQPQLAALAQSLAISCTSNSNLRKFELRSKTSQQPSHSWEVLERWAALVHALDLSRNTIHDESFFWTRDVASKLPHGWVGLVAVRNWCYYLTFSSFACRPGTSRSLSDFFKRVKRYFLDLISRCRQTYPWRCRFIKSDSRQQTPGP